MRHVRMLGLCLIAALAVGAFVVSSASALPEWGKCEAKTGGKFIDSNCTKKASLKNPGSFEYLKATQVAEKRVAEGKSKNVPFSGQSVGSGGTLRTALRTCEVLNEEGGRIAQARVTRQKCAEEKPRNEEILATGKEALTVECGNETNTGEAVAANKVANVHVTFTGCNLLGVAPCNSAGKAEGEIATSVLKGQLGYIKKSTKEVGVLLEPTKKGGSFAQFECPGIHATTVVGVGNSKEGAEFTSTGCFGVPCPGTTPTQEAHGGYDGIISPITPVNEETTKYTQVYTEESEFPFRNIPSKFEGKHIDVLEDYIQTEGPFSSMWSSAGEVITNVNTAEEAGEIKA